MFFRKSLSLLSQTLNHLCNFTSWHETIKIKTVNAIKKLYFSCTVDIISLNDKLTNPLFVEAFVVVV
jgi:hypothetical protein